MNVPSLTYFVSAEPLIGELDLSKFLDRLHWVIIGGESGHGFYPESSRWGYRKCETQWIKSIIKQCKKAKTAVFVKQMGTHLSTTEGLKDRHGGDPNEWDQYFRIREFPMHLFKPLIISEP